MERFKLGKKKSISMPSGWHEVPFKKGVKIFEEELNEVETVAMLTDSNVEDIRDATDPESIYYLLSAFRFLRDIPHGLDRPQLPNSIKLSGNHIIFPHIIEQDKFDLGRSSVGQIKDMEMVLVNMGAEFKEDQDRPFTQLETILMCPPICAIYIQKLIDKEYDYNKAMKLSEVIKEELSFKEVLHIGYFFLKRLADLNDGLKKDSQIIRSTLRKLKRGLMNLIRRMGSILH
jgi:hypothetical protein